MKRKRVALFGITAALCMTVAMPVFGESTVSENGFSDVAENIVTPVQTGEPEELQEGTVKDEPENEQEPVIVSDPVEGTDEEAGALMRAGEEAPVIADEQPEAIYADESAGSEDYVKRMYEIALKRDVDPSGFNDWNSALVNKTMSASGVAAGVFFSQEFKNRNVSNEEYVQLLYQAMFGRNFDSEGYQYWVGQLYKGYSRQSVFSGFADSTEFQNLCNSYEVEKGTFQANQYRDKDTFVTQMIIRYYNCLLDRNFDDEGLEYWCEQYHTGKGSLESIAADGFISSAEFTNKNYSNEDFTSKIYKAFLNREADRDGLVYWSGKLANGEMTRTNLAYGFTGSREFAVIKLGAGVNRTAGYKKVISFGDSIAGGSGVAKEWTYQGLIAGIFDSEVINLGYGGYSYSSYGGGASLTTKIKDIPYSSDRCLVLIEAGTNDFSLNSPAGLTTYTGDNTVAGALKIIMTGIKERMPYSDILILSPIKNSYGYSKNKRGVTLEAYSKTILDVANAYGYQTIDLFNEPGFNLYVHTSDSIHLSGDGHYFIANAILNHFRS